ncbi:glutamine amidotransferase, class I [Pseudooceanicola batsensis HTCC2597]|uniref:Glutamine amidotransferase, class I n=1 Tax=Pseudooceanicola batsensis (strain ATCC BAA-863 / DSM 15984 / KCTC 12145 / HTCC2597) TaxID=252305 RepID=A3U1U7_PSEBH|nr:type 1 glutamine amidotransferase [Pseudooceanicola batsensis]EAQ01881.1 glutamine amidotransferase, class I [Pseudooceanicola batsensis HTCC2597]
MLIGILQCGHFPDELLGETGDYDAIYERFLHDQGFDFAHYPVVDGVFPEGPEACDGWLISGSKHGAYEDHPWIPPLEELIRAIHDAGRPLVGICFGHQIIAQALGGKVEKFPGGWSAGRKIYHFADGDRALNAWHQDQITDLPPGAVRLASSDICVNAALAYDDRIYSIQPHPEFGPVEMKGLIRVRGSLLPDHVRAAAEAGLEAPVANEAEADRIAAFFRKAGA